MLVRPVELPLHPSGLRLEGIRLSRAVMIVDREESRPRGFEHLVPAAVASAVQGATKPEQQVRMLIRLISFRECYCLVVEAGCGRVRVQGRSAVPRSAE